MVTYQDCPRLCLPYRRELGVKNLNSRKCCITFWIHSFVGKKHFMLASKSELSLLLTSGVKVDDHPTINVQSCICLFYVLSIQHATINGHCFYTYLYRHSWLEPLTIVNAPAMESFLFGLLSQCTITLSPFALYLKRWELNKSRPFQVVAALRFQLFLQAFGQISFLDEAHRYSAVIVGRSNKTLSLNKWLSFGSFRLPAQI